MNDQDLFVQFILHPTKALDLRLEAQHIEFSEEGIGKLGVKWQTNSLMNNGLVVRDGVPKAHWRAISEVILGLHTHAAGQEILARMASLVTNPRLRRPMSRCENSSRDFELAFGRPPVPKGEL